MGTVVRIKSLAWYQIPQDICVACGGGPIVASVKKSTQTPHARLSVEFPVCQDCEAARTRVQAARAPARRRTRLLAIPVAVAVLAVYAIVSGHGPTSLDFAGDNGWFQMLLFFVPVWYACYRLIFWALRDLVSGVAPQDRARVKAIDHSVKIVLGDNMTQFTFSNPRYGIRFQNAHMGALK